MRKITKEIVTAFLAGETKKIGNSSTKCDRLFLHDNLIAESGHNRSYILTLATWNTRTTQERLNGLLETIGSNWRFCTRKRKPHIINIRTNELRSIEADKHYRFHLFWDSDFVTEYGSEDDDDGKKYEIIRFYHPSLNRKSRKIGKNGLTIGQAQSHCSDPKTRKDGQYFDGYCEQ